VEYYNPVTSLLLADKGQWKGMRTTAELRRQEQVPLPFKPDSEYKAATVERKARQFAPLHIPAKLQRELPFQSKPKLEKPRDPRRPTLEQRRAIVLEPKEKQEYAIIQALNTIRNVREDKRAEAKQRRMVRKAKEHALEDAKHVDSNREMRKKRIIAQVQGRPVKRKKVV